MPPPLGTFLKIHPIWRSHPSLSKCCFKTQKAQSLFYHLVNLYISLFCKRRQHFPKINIEAEVWLRFKGWILTKFLQFKFFQHSQDKLLSTFFLRLQKIASHMKQGRGREGDLASHEHFHFHLNGIGIKESCVVGFHISHFITISK